jgi:hypothetical protein
LLPDSGNLPHGRRRSEGQKERDEEHEGTHGHPDILLEGDGYRKGGT